MKNKMKFWRRSNALATAAGFDRSIPTHRFMFTTKKQVANGARRESELKTPSTLLVQMFQRVGLYPLP